jgi:hypothetical protein
LTTCFARILRAVKRRGKDGSAIEEILFLYLKHWSFHVLDCLKLFHFVSAFPSGLFCDSAGISSELNTGNFEIIATLVRGFKMPVFLESKIVNIGCHKTSLDGAHVTIKRRIIITLKKNFD